MRHHSRLSPKESKRVKEWIASHLRGARCESCRSPSARWTQGSNIVYLPDIINHDTHGYPVIVLICDNCGNVRTFSAEAMGLMKSDADENSDP